MSVPEHTPCYLEIVTAELGAEIALDSMEIPGQGRIAVYCHGGIEQGLWQLP